MKGRVLVSTHDLERMGALREAFREQGTPVELVTPGESLTEEAEPRVLLLTAQLNGVDEPDLLVEARQLSDVGILAFHSPDAAPGLVAPEGITELFPPDAHPDDVALVARRLLDRQRLKDVTGIVGETDAMREVLERVAQIAPVASTVLVTGESGTGKELVARGLHHLSPRRHKAFIAVNVAALSETLLESELFGHEKGAFTGAIDSRKGFFELAHGGTIFLDEIGEMPLATQTKLLRVLEEREFVRVGGESPIRVDVRIIAATNQDLRQLVTLGEFRKDLYYRLNVLHIRMPPLRDRRADIPRLVNRFVREVSERNDRPFVGISPEAMEILTSYHWPGNIRELRNLVESMVVLAPGREIQPSDIPPEVRSPGGAGDLLPAPIPRAGAGTGGDANLRPQLEFIFRTLVELRVDIDDLRKDFDDYQRGVGQVSAGGEVGLLPPTPLRGGRRLEELEDLRGVDVVDVPARSEPTGARREGPARPPGEGEAPMGEELDGEGGRDEAVQGGAVQGEVVQGPGAPGAEGVVVYRPGMTMDDMEREAIAAALAEVEGNRRKAAELLGIGERTLYRKIRKYELGS